MSRRQILNTSINQSKLNLLKFDSSKEQYDILRIDFERMNTLIEQSGGSHTFGDFESWDETFQLRGMYFNRSTATTIDENS